MSYLSVGDSLRLRIADRGAGPAIVLVHGWKMSHRAWDRVVQALAGEFRVVAYDLRGMGESDKPNCNYDFAEYGEDLHAVLSALEIEDATLVGWSMGCSVSLSCLSRRPARVGRLMLLNGPIKLISTDDFPFGITRELLDEVVADIADRWPEREREFNAKYFWKAHPEHVDWFTRIALQTPLDVVLRVVRNQAELDQRAVLAGLQIPVLAAYGRHDPYYDTGLADWIAATAPLGRAVIFERSAHCPPIEETQRFVQVLSEFARS